jgi:hypothetical protein
MITVDTYSNNPLRYQPVRDKIEALKEEIELEAVVRIVGGPDAQRAAEKHRLPDLVAQYAAEVNGHA